MAVIVEMPRLSDTMEEGTLASWMKKVGEQVSAGDPLAEIETDKAVQTFESFDDGKLLETLVEAGDTLPIGTPIAILGDEGEDIADVVKQAKARIAEALGGGGGGDAKPAKSSDDDSGSSDDEGEDDVDAADGRGADDDSESSEAGDDDAENDSETSKNDSGSKKTAARGGAKSDGGDGGGHAPPAPVDADGVRVAASPLARRIAAQRNIDLTTVVGTGPGGRVVKADVENLEPTRKVRVGVPLAASAREDEIVRVSQMRKTIARRLAESKFSAPHYYLTISIDAGPLVALRAQLNAAQDRVKLSFNDIIMKGVVKTLGAHPDVNVGWEGKTIRRFGGVHLGFAVAIEGGLITPVVRDADLLGIVGLAEKVRELAERARGKQLEEAEYSGNSFCVSNLGMYGIDHFTAVINPPAACILAIGAIAEQPVVVDGALTVGRRMSMTMSCDHRAVDGATGAAFLADLKKTLEAPLGALLDG